MVPKEKVEDVVVDANPIRVFTEKDFDSLKFDFTKGSKSTEPCLLKVKLSTYGIGSISMEYNWNNKGMYPSYIYSWSIGHILEHGFFC